MSNWSATEDGKAYHRKWRAENRERYREIRLKSHLKNEFGITPEQFWAIVAKQEHRCAICGEMLQPPGTTKRGAKNEMHLDHDHETGRVRGVLCSLCNRGLGHFKDNTSVLQRAVEYLTQHKED